MTPKPTFLLVPLAILFAGAAAAQPTVIAETLAPAVDFGAPEDGTFFDIWLFSCPQGGSATVAVDTLPVSGSGADSPLDPAFYVYDSTQTAPDQGNVVAEGDDQFSCAIPTVCGFDCPEAVVECTQGGEYRVMVWTWGDVSVGDYCGQQTGSYLLAVEVFDGPGTTGSSVDPKLGGEPVRVSFPGGPLPPGPAADDVLVVLPLPPIADPPPARGRKGAKP